jgi:23S rRNA (guanosine2251-2'-O)-methyltransferase
MIRSRIHPSEGAVGSRPRVGAWGLVDAARRARRGHAGRSGCGAAGIPIRPGDRAALGRAGGPSNQGVVARLAVRPYLPEESALAGARGDRFLLVLDEVQDPQNLGAALRVAEVIGAAVAVPERGSAPLSEAVARSSAGAVERVGVIRTGNLRRFLDRLKNQGFRVVGLDPSGSDIYGVDLTGDLALVLGAEGRGIRRLVREGCDLLARLPMRGKIGSLNVSTAAAAAGYEALRQRIRGKPLDSGKPP